MRHHSQYALVRKAGRNDINAITLFERPNAGAPDDGIRAWCRGMFVGETWSRVGSVERDGSHGILFHFAADRFVRFEGMPSKLWIERPSEVRLGSTWTLRGEDGRRVEALYTLRSDEKLRSSDVSRVEELYGGA